MKNKDIFKPVFKPILKSESQISKDIITKNPEKYGLTLSQVKYLK